MYRALTENRPYRPGLTHGKVMRLLRADTPDKLDGEVVDALDAAHRAGTLPAPPQAKPPSAPVS